MALAAMVKVAAGNSVEWDASTVNVGGGRRALQKANTGGAITWIADRPNDSTHLCLTKDTVSNVIAWRSSNDLAWTT